MLFRRIGTRNRRKVHDYFVALCRSDPQTEPDDAEPPPLRTGTPWDETAEVVREAISELRRRIADLERSRTAAELRSRRAAERESRMRKVFAAIADPILVIDDYDELLLANRGAEELFGFETDKAECKALARLVRCEQLVALLTSTRRRKFPANRSEELELSDAAGGKRWYRATAIKFADGEGEDQPSGGAVAVLQEVDDRKALQKRNAEFVSSVSHEMKTPLAGIKAYVELLADGEAEDEETREEFLNVINGQADRLQRLVDNMLNMARIEAGVVNVSKRPSSLNEILDEAFRVVQPSAEAKEIKLEQQLSTMYLGVLADHDMLLQAAINLLSNAVKYTSGGGSVTLRSRLADDQALFEVEDSGVGLSEEDAARVFEKFYRVKKDKQMASGTGLGLPLAKHIVEDVHGGRLTVESELGKGSTFIVALPCAAKMRGEGRGARGEGRG
ncbi:MAG: PAS domain S-box protein [Pirellulales bacterium]|nr:PAS domain S-box protein [Pirellulales bacterium]